MLDKPSTFFVNIVHAGAVSPLPNGSGVHTAGTPADRAAAAVPETQTVSSRAVTSTPAALAIGSGDGSCCIALLA